MSSGRVQLEDERLRKLDLLRHAVVEMEGDGASEAAGVHVREEDGEIDRRRVGAFEDLRDELLGGARQRCATLDWNDGFGTVSHVR